MARPGEDEFRMIFINAAPMEFQRETTNNFLIESRALGHRQGRPQDPPP